MKTYTHEIIKKHNTQTRNAKMAKALEMSAEAITALGIFGLGFLYFLFVV